MNRLLFIGMVIALSLLSFRLQAGTIDPGTPDHKYVTYGSKFHNVVKICCIDEDEQKYMGSAVVINPRWIVTAAHVVHSKKYSFIIVEDKKYEIKKIICHSDYNNSVFGQHDIALGYTTEPINLKFFPELYCDNDEEGKICSIAGLGYTGTFNTGSNLSDNKKRAGSNFIDKIEKGTLICSPSKSHKDKITELEFLIANGDSGGGLFIDGKLAGINSAVLSKDGSPNSSYSDESSHTRISNFHKWILEHTSKSE